MFNFTGGWGGIRTPGSLATSAVFKTVAFDRSATHPKLFHFPAGLSNLRFCSLTAPGGAAHHSFALGGTSFALLTRMQDRRIRPRLPPIQNFCLPAYSIPLFPETQTEIKKPPGWAISYSRQIVLGTMAVTVSRNAGSLKNCSRISGVVLCASSSKWAMYF